MDHNRTYKDGHASDHDAEDAISRSIKRVYDQVADEPIPDSLQSLLDRLKQERPPG